MKTDKSRRWWRIGAAGLVLGLVLGADRGRPAWGQEAFLAAEHPLVAVDAAGERLAAVLDGLDVQHRWRGGAGVDWRTGLVKPGELMLPSHSGEFVAAACDRLGAALLHPPEHSAPKLAAAQAAWLAGEGKARGWRQFGSRVEAQSLANRGFIVVVLVHERDPTRPGLAAIVRPGARPGPSVAADGPDVALAAHHNHNAIPLGAAFHVDPGEGEVVLFAHASQVTGATALDAALTPQPTGLVGGATMRVARVVEATAGLAPGGPPTSLAKVLAAAVPRWVSREGAVEKSHLLALAADPRIKGEQAAALAMLLHHIQKGKAATFSEAKLESLAEQRRLNQNYKALIARIPEIRRTLFVDGVPHLDRIEQGSIGDCYLFSGAGWMAYHRPRRVVEMIRPLQNGRFEVDFPSGERAVIDPPTDTEILYAESAGSLKDGLWVAVIEKAVGVLDAKRDRREAAIPDPTIRIGGGGFAKPDVHRWTGHAVDQFEFDDHRQVEQARRALAVMEHRHLMAQAETDKPKTPIPIPTNHVYAVLGFDPSAEVVTVWNPWGDDFTPKGPAGLKHGWPRKHGIFTIPFRDFVRVFARVAIERP